MSSQRGACIQLRSFLTLSLFYIVLSASTCGVVLGQEGKQLEESLGLVKLQLDREQSIDIELKGQERCFFGDLDIITLELRRAKPSTKLLLTLEPVLSKDASFKPIAVDISKMGKMRSVAQQLTLSLPKRTGPMLAGIFICTDSNAANRCSEKEIRPYDEIFADYEVILDKDKKRVYRFPGKQISKTATDKVLFFRYVLIDRNSLAFSEDPMNAEHHRNLERYAREFLKSSPSLPLSIGRIRFLSEAMGSLPLRLTKDKVGLKLPFYSAAKCEESPNGTDVK